MTQYLPPNLLALFAPRDPIPYFPPVDKPRFDKKEITFSGLGGYLHLFEDSNETPPAIPVKTKQEVKEAKLDARKKRVDARLEEALSQWDPYSDKAAQGTDAFKTLFIARINYDTSESKLRREFEVYGPIKKIHMVSDSSSGKPCGYAFLEYEHERDMHAAYKHGDGKKVDGRRVLVDVERGRTVKTWRPRRLGGGLGGTRRGGPAMNTRHSGREDPDRVGNGMDRDDVGGDRDRDDRDYRDRDRDRGDRDRGDRERGDRDRGDRERRRDRDRGGDRDRGDRDRDRERDRDRSDRRDRGDRGGGDRDRDRDRDRRHRDRDRGGDRDRDRDREDRRSRRDGSDGRVKEEDMED
ncbi:U1 small nuclear ribonucleoprotein 70 kDa-like isoform X2 [Sycon ciliatum]|uniref:U1 small nuclear ribonucleoprotein 70 kDa-like isoform X2 n=1 Tax=Sycon ciliatum TaxID=27933 RepID=UPI0031F65B60